MTERDRVLLRRRPDVLSWTELLERAARRREPAAPADARVGATR